MNTDRFINMLSQPDDSSCGPTSLQAVYRYHGLDLSLNEVLNSVDSFSKGGTLAVMLGMDALKRGFKTHIYSYNLKMFDPTWSQRSHMELVDLLEKQLKYKRSKKFEQATRAYQKYLLMGGEIYFEDLHRGIFLKYLERDIPVLTGLSATYLYGSQREYTHTNKRTIYDDIKGEPTGHFVVMYGIDNDEVLVADPYPQNPISGCNHYRVGFNRFANAIMLGVITYDANILIVMPPEDMHFYP